jgi:hypothetical protein
MKDKTYRVKTTVWTVGFNKYRLKKDDGVIVLREGENTVVIDNQYFSLPIEVDLEDFNIHCELP